jgi:hypothetical protein
MKKEIQWFARGGDISKMGPYASQELAAEALINVGGLPIDGAYVWPETKTQTRHYAKLAKEEAKRRQYSLTPAKLLYNALADECSRRGMKMPRGTR